MTALTNPIPNRFRSGVLLKALATIVAVVAPAIAQAQIVYSGVLDTVISGPLTLEFHGTPVDGSEMALYSRGAKPGLPPQDIYVNNFGSTAVDFTPVTLGDTIDASLPYVDTSPGNSVMGNERGSTYYYAFSYSSVSGTMYGWFNYSVATSNIANITLHDWAYNSIEGQSITVGQTISAVPEPATFGGLMGLAVLSAVCLRRRRPACTS